MSLTTLSKAMSFDTFFEGRTLPVASRALIVVSALLVAPGMRADCLPSAPNGWNVPFTMSTHNDTTHEVSYTTGTLVDSSPSFVRPSILSGSKFLQLFSDRFVPLPNPCGYQDCFSDNQPFAKSQADQIGVAITRSIATLGHPSTIVVTLTFESRGNTQATFAATCDASTNLLYGSYNNTMAVISFSPPSAPVVLN